jgi:hypothetical protein
MALTEREVIDLVEVLPESGNIQVRKATIIERDGVEVSRTFHRHVVQPLDDTTNEDDVVKSLSGIVVTPEIVAKEEAKVAAKEAEEAAAQAAAEEAAQAEAEAAAALAIETEENTPK